MLKIRLSRTGKKKQKSFKVVVQEHTAPVKGKFVEEIGFYRPSTVNKEANADVERVKYWMSKGAQPSDTLAVLLKKMGMSGMEKFIEPRNKKRKSRKQREEEMAASAAVPKAPGISAKTEASAEAPAVTESPASVETAA